MSHTPPEQPPARPGLMDRLWAWEPPTLGTGFVVVLGLLALGAVLVYRAPGLGWDEALYATQSRSFVTDVPASAWTIIRPPLLSWFGALAAPFGFFDESVRMVAMGLSVLGLAAYAWLGGLVGGRVVALAAILVAVTMPIVVVELRSFHNDLPSAGVLLALMALLWHQLEVRPAPDWRFLLAPVLAAVAFYLRFGTLAAIAAIGLTALLLWGPRLLRHRRLTAGALAIGIGLALPHVLLAIGETGSPLGILQQSADKVNTSDPFAAALVYLRGMNRTIAGPLAIGFFLAGGGLGAAVAVQWARRRGSRPLIRSTVWLLLPAAITTAALLAVSHAEGRYLLFPLLAVSLAGVLGVARTLMAMIRRWRPHDARRTAWVVLAALVVVVGAVTIRNVRTRAPIGPDQASWVAETGAWIRGHRSTPCLVIGTMYPILGWYAACASNEFHNAPAALLPPDPPPGSTYIVFTTWDLHRRRAATIARYRAVASEPIARIGTQANGSEITLLQP